MGLVSHTVASLVGASAYLGAVAQAAAAAGVLDIGLVFPRQNETYAPMQRFPVIFALQNAELAKHLEPIVDLDVLNGSMTMVEIINERTFSLKWTNYTTEPYLLYAFMDFEIEGPLQLLWTTWWRRCDESSGDEVRIVSNSSGQLRLNFNIKQGAQKADLVETTANEEKCPTDVGVAITVTDKTYDVPEPLSGNDQYGTCAVVASPSPTPISNPCRVKIDKATLESMEAVEQARRCRRLNPPADCPEEDRAIQNLVVAGGATLAAALGAAVFLLA